MPAVRPASLVPTLLVVAVATAARAADGDVAFYESHVRPVFVRHCHACHSADAAEVRSGLRVDDRDALLAGGDGGVVVVPGRPEESRLLAVLRSTDPDVQMPPADDGGPLPAPDVEAIAEWIRRGAAMPAGRPLATNPAATLATHWAFQPVRDAAPPPVVDGTWAWTDVDRFLLAALEAAGLAAVPDAAPAALLRRVHLDLTGLPPEPDEVTAFLADPTCKRLAATIDRLLASPRFGERWGRHWLDVARYAESSGKETDFAYPNAWRYRDYVIRAVGDDMPFDRFAMEQIAGDFFEARDDRERAELLVATGFLAIGPKSHIERNRLQFQMDVADEQIDAVSQAFLGLTIACARCHDHKYDPVSQRDYYALAGIFRSTDTRYGTIRILQNANPGQLVELPASAGQPDGMPPLDARGRRILDDQLAIATDRLADLRRGGDGANAGQGVQFAVRRATLQSRLDAYDDSGRPRRLTMAALDYPRPVDSPLFLRGEVAKPGTIVPRGLPALAGSAPRTLDGSGRLELARWIASPDNPLTPRVIVNRVWLHLFGGGLVATPDNFGVAGEPPSHPELLDHLAARFVARGWRLKPLIRELMLSHAYALATAHDDRCFDADPDNRLRWRMSPRRHDAEVIRDGILATAGTLDLEPPRGSTVPDYAEGFVAAALRGRRRPLDETVFTRAVYLPAIRGTPLDSLAVFDMTAGSVVTGQRPETVVPAQSLYLLNSGFVMAQADAAARRLAADRSSDRSRVELAYLRFLGRPATAREVDAAVAFVGGRSRGRDGWSEFCQSLWASHEFLSRH